jgi:hypothetical protein
MIIYRATNLINGKVYIGKTIYSIRYRKKQHKTDSKNKINNMVFHKAIRKYGFENFKWSIIDTAENEAELNKKEIYWIAEYKKTHIVYNMTNGGNGLSGYRPTKETREKISKKLKGRPSKKKGKKLSKETCQKMSQSKIGNTNSKGVKHTKETREKISKSLIGNMRSVGKLGGKKNGMYGKRHTPEAIEKMRKAASNRIVNSETRLRMSLSQKKRFEREKNSSRNSGI